MDRDNDGSVRTGPRDPGGRGIGVSGQGLPETGSSTATPAPLPSALADELFSTLAHELRAPLTTIKGSSRTLLRHGAALEPATARQLLQDIDQEADRLHRLVDNLLELARAGVGANALRTEPTAVDVLLRRVVADATPRAGSRRLRVRAPGDLPSPAIDPVRIEQVVRNLIDNAVKFSAPDGTIDISAARQDDAIVVAVRDDGPGVAAEYHERVFERFFRVEREGSNVAGAGLGLAICKRFVELHGGRIELESRPGHGATFRFTLPLDEQVTVSETAPVSESAPC
jgi:two-component system sensor histidine kinase KdpD